MALSSFTPDVTVIGGGLAGCEAAWQLAERGHKVALVEQKPARLSPAHTTPLLCELVCSNSLRGNSAEHPAGLLKEELRRLGSLVLQMADRHAVPAGDALAVDRHRFSRGVTVAIAGHRNIRLERRGVERFPDGPTILAGGPLVGGGVARALRKLCGDRFYFYDAIAPIVEADSIDWNHAFRGARWGRGTTEGDYVNCPMTMEQYYAFVDALCTGRKVAPHRFEQPRYFEGCLPIEVMAERGKETLAFGPMKPIGLDTDAYAVVQLRLENRYGTSYNLVGFQTRLAYPEQKRIFGMIPALANAEFVRFGSIHRNSYVEAARLLDDTLALRVLPHVHLAGQITGVEGYIESTAIGLLVARFVDAKQRGAAIVPPPPETAFGALYHHVREEREGGKYQPSNINYGLFPPLPKRHKKRDRRPLYAERARDALAPWLG